MNRQRLQSYEMLTRVVSFGNRNVSLFSKKSAAAEILKGVESDVEALSETTNQALATEAAMRSNSKTRKASREGLKDCLVRAGRMCHEFQSPQLQLPKNVNDQVLLALARGFVADAESVKSDFAQHGLPIEEIDTAVQNFEQAVGDYSNAKAEHSAAIQKWDAALSDALGRLRKLDLLVMNVLKENPIATSEYETARTIPRPAGRKKATASAPAPPAPAAPDAVTASAA